MKRSGEFCKKVAKNLPMAILTIGGDFCNFFVENHQQLVYSRLGVSAKENCKNPPFEYATALRTGACWGTAHDGPNQLAWCIWLVHDPSHATVLGHVHSTFWTRHADRLPSPVATSGGRGGKSKNKAINREQRLKLYLNKERQVSKFLPDQKTN